MGTFTNSDGLTILTNEDQGRVATKGGKAPNVTYERELRFDLDATALPAAGGQTFDVFVPAGSYIESARLIVTTAFAGGTNVTIGLAQRNGTPIDADGIDATVATAALAANKVVRCDGALVGGADGVGANDAYVYAAASGTYTAGRATLIIKYIDLA